MAGERLGEFMIRKGYLTAEQLEAALAHQRRMGGRLGTVLWRLKMMDERLLVRALGEYFGCPYTILRGKRIPRDALETISAATARKLKALPLKIEQTQDGKKKLYVAMRNPKDLPAIEHIRLITGYEVQPVVALDPDIEEAIEMNYSEEIAHRPEPLTLDEDLLASAPGQVFYTDESQLEPHELTKKAERKLEDTGITLHLDPNIDTRVYLTYLIKLLIKYGVLSKDDFEGLIIED